MRSIILLAVFVSVILIAVLPLIAEAPTTGNVISSCEFEYQHAKSNEPPPATWIYRSNTGDYPQPHNYHAPGFAPPLVDNVLDVRNPKPEIAPYAAR